MTTQKTFTGKNVDEATENALRALDANLEDVEIKVVNPGRSGILGFGGEPAEIEVTLLGEPSRASRGGDDSEAEAPSPRRGQRRSRRTSSRRSSSRSDDEAQDESDDGAARPSAPKAPPTIIKVDDDDDSDDESDDTVASGDGEEDEDRDERRRGRRRGRRGGRGRRRNGAYDEGESGEEPGSSDDEEADGDSYAEAEYGEEEDYEERRDDGPPAERDAEAEQLVGELLDYFLGTMGVVAETFVRDETDNGSLVFEIEGEDAGLLIGRRGETLQALQFLTRLIVNRQLGRKAYIMIDIEGYRERRFDMLRRLARRTAGRVASSGRPAELDPMSPGERRIVHLSLARHPRVRTESEGEGNRRHVVIRPKR